MQVERRARNELKEMDKQVFKRLSEFLEDDLEYRFFQTKTFSLDWNYFSFTQMKKICSHRLFKIWHNLLSILHVKNFLRFSSQQFRGATPDAGDVQGADREHDINLQRIEQICVINTATRR